MNFKALKIGWLTVFIYLLLLLSCVSGEKEDQVFNSSDIIFKVTHIYEDEAVLEGRIVTKGVGSINVADKYEVFKYDMDLGVAKVVEVNVDIVKLQFQEKSAKSSMEMLQVTDMLTLRHYENETVTTGKATNVE